MHEGPGHSGLRRGLSEWNAMDHPQGGLVQVADTQLGRRELLHPNDSPVPLIWAEGKSQDARMATIHCQVTGTSPAAWPAGADRRAPIKGLLGWGQGGARFSAEIDLRTGVVASVVASSVSLSAQFEQESGSLIPEVVVAGAIVWGTRPGRGRCTRTLPRVTIPIGGSATFEVPPFAYTVTPYTTAAGWYALASSTPITLHEGPTAADDPELVITAGELGSGVLLFDGLNLSGNTRYVTVGNTTGAPLPMRLTFGLEL